MELSMLIGILVLYIGFATGVIYFVFGGFLYGAMWMPLPKKRVQKMLELGNVGKDKIVFDLGAGFGNVAFKAALSGASVVAVEADGFKARWIKWQIKRKELKNMVCLKSNLLEVDLSKADVLLCYLSDALMSKIAKMSLKESIVIVSASHKIKGLTPKVIDKDSLYPLYVY